MYQHRPVQPVGGTVRQERLRQSKLLDGQPLRRAESPQSREHRYPPLHANEARRHGIQDREARAQLPALLANRHADHLLSARLVVHPLHCRTRQDDRTQQNHQLAARINRNRTIRQMAREPQRLEPLPLTLLGHTAAYLAHKERTRGDLHRFDRRTLCRDRQSRRCRCDESQPVAELQSRRLQHRELRTNQHRPPSPVRRSDRARLANGTTYVPRTGSD